MQAFDSLDYHLLLDHLFDFGAVAMNFNGFLIILVIISSRLSVVTNILIGVHCLEVFLRTVPLGLYCFSVC